MARLWQCGFELRSVTNGVEWDTTTQGPGSVAIDTSIVRTGGASLKVVTSNSASNYIEHQVTSANSRLLTRFYVYFSAFPTDTLGAMVQHNSSTSVTVSCISITTAGKLRLHNGNSAAAQLGSDSPGLKLNTWYRVEFDTNGNTASAYLEGVRFATGPLTTTTNAFQVDLGMPDFVANMIAYFDDIAVNDATGTNQNSLPGPGGIVHLKPNATGDSSGFTVAVGGTAGAANNFTRVQEITPDDVTTYNAAALLNAEDLFNCDNFTGGAFSSMNVVAVGARFTDLVSADATSGIKLELLKTSAGTKSQSATIVPNSTAFRTNAGAVPRVYPLITYANPDGGEWTQAFLDSLQVGYINSAVGVQAVAVSTVWVSVDFTAALPGGTTTSTSSTSASTFSTSSTSSSTSSTSSSISSTSNSTSTSSTSSSISSTSSSTSSTSASTSSTSASSTSASTSISSTSSSISSTSFSSTSQSSTSSSSSISSTSSSFSSTSSSISSTSASTSSTSQSSTSSSSSTSTTAIELKRNYRYEDDNILDTDNANIDNPFTSPQESRVGADDGDYMIKYGSEYIMSQYKYTHINNTDACRFTWKGRSTYDTRQSPVYLQIYNQITPGWETLARETRIPADTDYVNVVAQSTNMSNYYDSNNTITFRSYQQVI